MLLPPGFPHSPHEQYVVALPVELLSPAETWEAIDVLERTRRFVAAYRQTWAAELVRRGWSEEDIERIGRPPELSADFFPATTGPARD
jgi:hypothetical protein